MLNARLRATWVANAASGAAAVTVGTPFRARSAYTLHRADHVRVQQDSIIASDLELVTVTDTTAILTWTTRARDHAGRLRPAPADTEIRIAPADAAHPPRRYSLDSRPTAYHYAQIEGLEPGRAYRFEAYSGGYRAAPARTLVTRRAGSPETTGVFTTLTPPPGTLLRTIALANDVHYGESTSGLIVAGFPNGLRHDTHSHPEIMLDALLSDVRATDRGTDHLIVAGDMTDSGTLEQSSAVRARLDSWGAAGRDYFVCRGNHDVSREADPWGSVFDARGRVAVSDVDGLRIIALDTTRPRGSGGTLTAPQLSQLREALATEPDRPILMFGHHPVTSSAAVSNPAGPGFVLDRASAAALHALYRRAPGVFLHHTGHTHRNRVGRPDSPVNVEFLEGAAVKEYPGGYLLLRIYSGGYMVNFYKTRAEQALRWSTRTRKQYFGLHPDHALGSLADRNHVVLRDFSGLR
ncbi:metallophosphoesterase [Nocardia macrotermitis]|uniref:3',5'-cyclic adenosine monophosphate phosphodiesterase CpdA n=1 Tax=Nocardia macrotermitis TaxID=2585198 RepID=A0A7K0D4F9_9NOCA|nr:metallophosphoesterase [Nocardia macrotermitis]MQY20620.1 3',5'-cyclic adenosine monophosphate phosphodiesterase CpdA [Nocardia macrotermitis]